MLQLPVSKKNVADYNKFVLPEDEMWIKKINGKLGKSGYTSGQQFKADVRQLKVNAEGYNLGGGLCAYPGAATTDFPPPPSHASFPPCILSPMSPHKSGLIPLNQCQYVLSYESVTGSDCSVPELSTVLSCKIE